MHDVSIIWEFWPFTAILPMVVRDLLTGYGINPVFTWMMDLTEVPRWIWNTFVGSFLGAFTGINSIFTLLYYVPNYVYLLIFGSYRLVFQYVLSFIRSVTGWFNFESFIAVILASAGLITVLITSGALDVPAEESGAADATQ